VLLVSHDMAMVSRLATRVVWLKNGKRHQSGTTAKVIESYMSELVSEKEATPTIDLQGLGIEHGRPPKLLRRLTITDATGIPTLVVPTGGAVQFHLSYDADQCPRDVSFSVDIRDSAGQALTQLCTRAQGVSSGAIGTGRLTCTVPKLRLLPGKYSISLRAADLEDYIDVLEEVVRIRVVSADYFGTGRLPHREFGRVISDATWSAKENSRVLSAP
jgi:lipopolysaccharide transport system ATP-binding protein